MKKPLKPNNPLKTFNDNVAMAHMKAGGQMKAYNKYLKKLQGGGGSGMGRMAADDAAFENMLNQYPASPPAKPNLTPPAGTPSVYSSVNPSTAMQKIMSMSKPEGVIGTQSMQSTPAPRQRANTLNMSVPTSSPYKQRRGGAVKNKKRK
jgi:hypothetical protein